MSSIQKQSPLPYITHFNTSRGGIFPLGQLDRNHPHALNHPASRAQAQQSRSTKHAHRYFALERGDDSESRLHHATELVLPEPHRLSRAVVALFTWGDESKFEIAHLLRRKFNNATSIGTTFTYRAASSRHVGPLRDCRPRCPIVRRLQER